MKKLFILYLLFFVTIFSINAAKPVNFPEIDGWKKSTEIKTYESDNLWDYINGAAVNYQGYDFQLLNVIDYIKSDDVYVTVEVYQHSTLENTFGIYSMERPREGNYVSIGAEGYTEKGILNFVKGKYYVKMRSTGGDEADNAVETIGGKIALSLEGENKLPKPIGLLPSENKINKSTLFVSSNFLGYSYLNHAFIADYKEGENSFRLFILQRDSPCEIEELLNTYFEKMPGSSQLEDGFYKVDDKYNGTVYLMRKENTLAGSLEIENKDMVRKYLKKVFNQ